MTSPSPTPPGATPATGSPAVDGVVGPAGGVAPGTPEPIGGASPPGVGGLPAAGRAEVHPRSGTAAVLAGGAASSLAAYGFQIVGARALGDAAYAPVGILWTLQYLVLTIGLLSVEAHVTRRRGVSPGVWRWVAALTVAVTAATAAGGSVLFEDPSPAWPAIAAAITAAFGLFAIVRGQAAADGDFRGYGVLTGAESTIRLVLAVGLLAVGAGAVGLAWTLPAGVALAAAGWLVRRRLRPLPSGSGGTLEFFAATTSANGIAQLLLASGPLVVAALGAGAAATTVVFVTTTAARAPLVFIHSGLLAKVLPPMRAMLAEGRHAELRRRVARTAVPVAAVIALAGAVGAVAGPVLVAIAFGADLRPPVLLAALTAASVATAMAALVANQVAIALDVQGRLLGPWLLGLAVGAGALVAFADRPVTAVAVASAAGLVTAAAAVLAVVLRHLRTGAR